MNTQQQIVIMSAPTEADLAGMSVGLRHAGYATAYVEGSYRGVKERSIVVVVRDAGKDIPSLLRAARNFDQEPILYVDSAGDSVLMFTAMGKDPVRLGAFREVSESRALAADAWTRFNGRYFMAG